MQQRPCTIAVFGLFGSTNLGNEATLAAFLQHMRARLPDSDILSVVPLNSAIEPTHGLRKVPIDPLPVQRAFWRLEPEWLRRFVVSVATVLTEPWRRRRARRSLEGVQTLVVAGTGIVDDFGQGSLDLPLHLDRWTAAARAVGAHVTFASIGVSRVASALSRALFRRALRRATYCSFRDDVSRDNARSLGFDSGLVMPDLAFSLQPTSRREAECPPQTVGVGVMGYFGWNLPPDAGIRVYREYIDRSRELIRRLLKLGYRVRVLIGDSAADERARHDIATSIDDESFTSPTITTYRHLLDEIELCDVVVATRYHNVLFALRAGRPTVSIGYSDKNDALMRSMGQTPYSNTIDACDVDKVLAQLTELAANQPSRTLREKAEQMRRQLAEQYDRLAALACGAVTESARPSQNAR